MSLELVLWLKIIGAVAAFILALYLALAIQRLRGELNEFRRQAKRVPYIGYTHPHRPRQNGSHDGYLWSQ